MFGGQKTPQMDRWHNGTVVKCKQLENRYKLRYLIKDRIVRMKRILQSKTTGFLFEQQLNRRWILTIQRDIFQDTTSYICNWPLAKPRLPWLLLLRLSNIRNRHAISPYQQLADQRKQCPENLSENIREALTERRLHVKTTLTVWFVGGVRWLNGNITTERSRDTQDSTVQVTDKKKGGATTFLYSRTSRRVSKSTSQDTFKRRLWR